MHPQPFYCCKIYPTLIASNLYPPPKKWSAVLKGVNVNLSLINTNLKLTLLVLQQKKKKKKKKIKGRKSTSTSPLDSVRLASWNHFREFSPLFTWGAEITESFQSTGYLGAERIGSHQSPGYLGTENYCVPPVHRVPGGRKDLSLASPQGTWGPKGLESC